MERSTAFDWVGIIVGDLHMKGSLCQCCFKEQGKGGMQYLNQTVIKRPQLTVDAFTDKKYEKNNSRSIKEAVRDCGRSYCLSAVSVFRQSEFFPDVNSLRTTARRDGNHNRVILDKFLK